jgi:hypothetical protein
MAAMNAPTVNQSAGPARAGRFPVEMVANRLGTERAGDRCRNREDQRQRGEQL